MRFGHERCVDIMLQRGLADGALEQENLVGQLQRIAMIEIDLKLGRTTFMAQRIDVEFLRLAVVIDILDDRIEIIGGVDAVGLSARLLAAGAANGGIERIVRINVLFHQVEFEFGRHHRPPTLFLVEPQYALQDMTG